MEDTASDVFIQLKYRIVVDKDGTRCYYNAVGQLHNEDGPAVILPTGSEFWYYNGQRHRENGPAIEWHDGTKEWHIFGKRYTEDKYWSELSEAQWQR